MKNFIDEKIKKSYVTKGFLSTNDQPTQNANTMYSVYLINLPEGWNERIIYQPAVDKVREHFGVDYGFDRMIMWGINYSCSKSKTSSGRYKAMNDAYLMAKYCLRIGMVITDKKVK